MPMPVSQTVSDTLRPGASPRTIRPHLAAFGVNLTALLSRLSRICLRRRPSADQRATAGSLIEG